jgi:Flp pilus assembly pilin Flp
MASLSRIRHALGRPIGASAVEYIVAIILVTLVVMATVRVFGTTVKERFQAGSQRIDTMEKAKDGGGSGTIGSSSSSDKVVSGTPRYKNEDERQKALLAKEAQKKQKAKFNPIIIFIFVGLVGLLLFVVLRGNSYN